MDDDATQEPPAQSGQLSLQTSSATASADQPIIATSFPQFAFLPEEIRRLIWQYACIPTRMQCLQFPTYCALPRVGRLDDPADAPKFNYDGVRDDLAMLIANSENYQQQWSVPGCHKFRRFFWRRDLNGLSAVCPESRDVYFNLVKHTEQNRLTIKKGVHVNDSFDIFHFSTRNPLKYVTAFLLNMRPRLRPINLAISLDLDTISIATTDKGMEAHHQFPSWLLKAIEWGREAKEGHNNSPTTSLTPSIDDVMIDLQDLQAVFLLDSRIKLRKNNQNDANEQTPTGPAPADLLPLAHQYNILAHGMRENFYGLSPGNKEVMKNWDVPAYVLPVLDTTKKLIGYSDDWKVNIYLMAKISKKTR
ncbi:hypothetical protein SLS64_002599 [Diaporthe eres]|uniref:2EXR domain-containing protein n=1 Tax=Diaporthe eres TaxID=83184 RepID=A0ABR1PFS6_DIAER